MLTGRQAGGQAGQPDWSRGSGSTVFCPPLIYIYISKLLKKKPKKEKNENPNNTKKKKKTQIISYKKKLHKK